MTKRMTRREALRLIAGTTGLSLGLSPWAAYGNYTGKLLVVVQADGGWDPPSFCDPKENRPGEPVINHWAEQASIQQAGNIPYAPFAGNQAFFEKYHQRMLVINGVDAQTNSHTVGVVHNWSGRVSEGFPSLSALVSAHHAPALSMSYLNFGGYAQTAGITRYTRIDDPNLIVNIASPNVRPDHPGGGYLEDADWALVKSYRDAAMAGLAGEQDLSPRALRNRGFYQTALIASEEIAQFADLIPPPEQLQQPETFGNFYSTLKRQAQVALLAFKSGVSITADLFLGGFDTHANHDRDHEPLLANLTAGIDFLWEYAETVGLADRLLVVVGSDFGRTPHYNADDGKDHSPIGSVIVMEKNQTWTNRVVGASLIQQHPDSDSQNVTLPVRVDPWTLTPDEAGIVIFPKHVHKALRDYMGVGASPAAAAFPFANTEDLPLFS